LRSRNITGGYKVIRHWKEGIPEYLKKGREERSWSRIARFRLGNEVREGLYWEEEEKESAEYVRGKRRHGNTYGKGVRGGRSGRGRDGRR